MDNFDLPMKFHNFVRMFVLPVDFIITLYVFHNYFISKDFIVAAAFRNVLLAYFVVKVIQTVVNLITQVGFVTYSGYAFYGIFVYFGLRIVLCSLILFGYIRPIFNRNFPDIIKVDLIIDIWVMSSFLFSIVTMGVVVLYYMLRKNAFYFRQPRGDKPKPIKERNYPWKYNEKYKPGRKHRVSRRKMRDIKDRRLDVLGGKEKTPDSTPEADVNG